MTKHTTWTDAETKFVQTHFDPTIRISEACKILAEHLHGKNPNQIQYKLVKLGLYKQRKHTPRSEWSEEELDILRKHHTDNKLTLKLLSGSKHTPWHIRRKREELGLYILPKWDDKKDKRLLKHAGRSDNDLKRLFKPHSIYSIHYRLQYLRDKLYNSPELLIKPDKDYSLRDLSPDMYQILLGSVIGNCSVGDSVDFGFIGNNSKDYRDFTIWGADIFKQFLPIIDIRDHPIMQSILKMPVTSLLDEFGLNTIRDGRLPLDHLRQLNPLGFMVWYMFRGNPNPIKCAGGHMNCYPTIQGRGYTIDALAEGVEVLNKNFKTGMKIYEHDRGNDSARIHLYSDARNKMFPIWEQLYEKLNVPDCMSYKIGLDHTASTRCGPQKSWFTDEEEKIYQKYKNDGIGVLKLALPHRSDQSLYTRLRGESKTP